MKHLPSCGALITAAGCSTRMGVTKPLLPYREGTMLSATIHALQDAGVEAIYVTVGHEGQAVSAETVRCGAIPVPLPDYERKQMFDSILCGLAAMRQSGMSAQVLIHPCDAPSVAPQTMYQLRTVLAFAGACAIRPSFANRGGHPLLLDASLLPGLLAYSGDGGLRGYLRTLGDRFLTLPCYDATVLEDADTPAQYHEICRNPKKPPTASIPHALFLEMVVGGLAPPLQAHVRAVASYADELAEGLCNAGVPLDRALLRAACLLHDMCRTEGDHARVAAAHLQRMGFHSVAAVVGQHHSLIDTSALSEALLLAYADRRTHGAHLTTLETRFAQSYEKCHTTEARTMHAARYQNAKAMETLLLSTLRRTGGSLVRSADLTQRTVL
ncbi:NTP transferase domain-containing protein [Eubacteriales bacterium OttesenSCG-928-A19]|nr:NTP transferase domain-containing protein [Eubacteriales bacterium OttesenSCG-928-A19]